MEKNNDDKKEYKFKYKPTKYIDTDSVVRHKTFTDKWNYNITSIRKFIKDNYNFRKANRLYYDRSPINTKDVKFFKFNRFTDFVDTALEYFNNLNITKFTETEYLSKENFQRLEMASTHLIDVLSDCVYEIHNNRTNKTIKYRKKQKVDKPKISNALKNLKIDLEIKMDNMAKNGVFKKRFKSIHDDYDYDKKTYDDIDEKMSKRYEFSLEEDNITYENFDEDEFLDGDKD